MKKRHQKQMAYLFGYLRPHKKVLIISLGLSMISTILGMVQPYFAKLLIDRVFMERISGLLLPLLCAMVFMLLVAFVLRTVNNYIYTRYSARLLFKMREDLFAHLHRIPLKHYARWKSGDIFSRIADDMTEIQGLITELFPNFLFNLLTALATGAVLLWLDWKMAVLSYCLLPLALFTIHKLRPKLELLARKMTESNADLSHFLIESLGGTALVRSFDAEEMETDKLRNKQSGILGLLMNYQVLGVVSGLVPTAFIIVNSIVVFGYGGYQVLGGTLSLGSLMAFSIYQGRVLAPLQGLMNGFLALQKARVSLQRVEEILDLEPVQSQYGTETIPASSVRGRVVFDQVCFEYEPGKTVLNALSLQLAPGTTTAVVGPSGVGKSTLCHLLMRLLDPLSGRIELDGINLNRLCSSWLRKQVAMVSQDIFLFHTTIWENIRFARPDATDEEIQAAARAACVDEFVQKLPHGYQTEVGDRGIRLSGGQRQRISIARAMLMKPAVLILDEATAYLDKALEKQIRQSLEVLMKNRTLLMISHRDSSIENVDQVIVLDQAENRLQDVPSHDAA